MSLFKAYTCRSSPRHVVQGLKSRDTYHRIFPKHVSNGAELVPIRKHGCHRFLTVAALVFIPLGVTPLRPLLPPAGGSTNGHTVNVFHGSIEEHYARVSDVLEVADILCLKK